MKILLSFIIGAIVFGMSKVVLNRNLADKKKLSKTRALIISLFLSIIAAICSYKICCDVKDTLNIAKMLIILIVVSGAGVFDFRECRIPNIFPAVLSISAIIILGIGYFISQQGALAYITSSVFATVICAFGLIIASLLTKQGIGAGDIKLLCSIALMGGVNVLGGTLFFGIVSCAATAAILLIAKKKTLKESLPFGPFIYLGYLISVFVLNY